MNAGKADAGCSYEWIEKFGRKYIFICDKLPYEDAQFDCMDNGADLVTINSFREAEFLKKHLMKIISHISQASWWIGLRYLDDYWKWTDGTEFNETKTPWAPGEPNNGRGTEDCVEFSYKGQLNDNVCETPRPYICEKFPPNTARTRHPDTTAPDSSHTSHKDWSGIDKDSSRIMTSHLNTDDMYPTSPTTADEESLFTLHSRVPKNVCIYSHNRKVYVQEKGFCPEEVLMEIKWPRIKAGATAMVPCPSGLNFAYRKCMKEPACWKETHNIKHCVSHKMKNFIANAERQLQGGSSKDSVQISNALAEVTENKDMTMEDFTMASQYFDILTRSLEDVAIDQPGDVDTLVKDVVKVSSNMMSSNKSKVWNKLSAEEKVRSASNLLHTVDKATMTLVSAIDKPDVIKRSDENVEAELRVLNVSKIAEPEVTYKPSSGGSFSLPSENLRRISKGKLAKVVFVTYHSIGELMPTTSTRTTKGEKEVVIQSEIISATIADYHGEVLPKPVFFSMKHTKPLPPGVQPLCSFWNMSADSRSYCWSQEGCSLVSTNAQSTTCKCNHLTNFAILMDVEGIKLSLSHQNALRIITYVGCAISLICLFLSWITFMLVPSIRGERNSIHKNLVFCLFAAELLFMVGIHRTDDKLLCSIFAGVLHYLFLAAFSWMLMEAAKILIMIIQVFNSSKSKMIYFYIFGYGFPAIIVGISAAVNLEGYGTDKHCWLSTENYFVWAFNGPVAFILLVNAVVLTYALVTIYKHSGYVIPDDMVGTVAAWAKGALSLEVILGVTWLFGFFFVSHSTLIMAYIFAILNTLQGFFIYCFHCLGNKQVWKEYKKLLGLKEKSGTATSTKTASISRKPTDAATYEMAAPNHKN